MSEDERDYFTKFGTSWIESIVSSVCNDSWFYNRSSTYYTLQIFIAADAKKEFDQQVIEYRATGSYQPSKHFERLENSSVWIRKDNPSPLEKEISSYDTILFPKRPPEMEEAYREREIRSITKRRLKLKGLWNEDLKTWREGVDFDAECDKERTKRAKQSHNVDDVEATASVQNKNYD